MKLVRTLAATVLMALLVALFAAAPAQARARTPWAPEASKPSCARIPFVYDGPARCAAWERYQRLEDLMIGGTGTTRAAALQTLYLQFGKKGSLFYSAEWQAATASRYPSSVCGQEILRQATWMNYEMYKKDWNIYATELWAKPLLDRANPFNMLKLGDRVKTIVAAKKGKAAGVAAKIAVESLSPLDAGYATVLAGAIGVASNKATQAIFVNRAGSIDMVC